VLAALWPRYSEAWTKSPVLKGIMGILCLLPAWMAINFILFVAGPLNLLFLFALVWSADSGAWFFGKLCGRHRLAPHISPGKTFEGVLGGIVTALAVTGIAFWWSGAPSRILPGVLLLSFVTVLFSVLGDLFESMLKRQAGLKDSGRLLPGHGGLLDRIDGLLAAAPVYVTGTLLLNHVLQ
jgi:phosphatidate cytidylyltransferase